MRNAFAKSIIELAEKDERVVLLTGDLGFMVLEPFARQFPKRFYNVGAAEQNMVGVATGLAEAGFIPFVYSIANFASLRPYEFIRNGPLLHRLPVRIVGIGDGFDYGPAGPTHHGLEDVGVMRLLPGMTVIAPASPSQTRTALQETYALAGPVYYRLGKASGKPLPEIGFHPETIETLRPGRDALILTLGGIAQEALAAAEKLEAKGVFLEVAAVAQVAPAPESAIFEMARRFPVVATLEAHYVCGGIGSLVAEIIAEHGIKTRLVRFGVREFSSGRTGSTTWLRKRHGLDGESVAETILQVLGGRR